jgi:serine/threonine protein kinase
MGEVYKALDTRLNRTVALKILPEDFAHVPGRRQRFELEAKALAGLNHPNLLSNLRRGREVVRGRTGQRPAAHRSRAHRQGEA